MLAKVCPSCGRLHAKGEACPVRTEMRKLYDHKQREQNTEIRKFRNTRWRKIRDYVAQRDGGCLICRDLDMAGSDTIEIHHITPLVENFDLADDETNLLTACRYHHELCESGELSRDYQRELVARSIK